MSKEDTTDTRSVQEIADDKELAEMIRIEARQAEQVDLGEAEVGKESAAIDARKQKEKKKSAVKPPVEKKVTKKAGVKPAVKKIPKTSEKIIKAARKDPNKKTPIVKKVTSKSRIIVSKSEILRLDPTRIVIPDDWNTRIDFGNMVELEASIKSEGVLTPILVKKVGNDYVLVAGWRRMRAVAALLKAGGHKIISVPAILQRKGISDIEAMLQNLTTNYGKEFTPLEEAETFRKLIAWGMPEEDIAKRTGKAISTVRGRLLLVDAAPSVRNAVHKGQISLSIAKKIVRASGGDIKKQDSAVTDAKKAKTSMQRKENQGKLTEKQNQMENKSLSGKRARDILLELGSAYTRFCRSGRKATKHNKSWVELEKVLDKIRILKRKGLLS